MNNTEVKSNGDESDYASCLSRNDSVDSIQSGISNRSLAIGEYGLEGEILPSIAFEDGSFLSEQIAAFDADKRQKGWVDYFWSYLPFSNDREDREIVIRKLVTEFGNLRSRYDRLRRQHIITVEKLHQSYLNSSSTDLAKNEYMASLAESEEANRLLNQRLKEELSRQKQKQTGLKKVLLMKCEEIKSLKESNGYLAIQVEQQDRKVEDLQERLSEIEEDLELSKEHREDLKKKLVLADEMLVEKSDGLVELEIEIEASSKILVQKDAEINKKLNDIAKRDGVINKMKEQFVKQKNKLAEMTAELENKQIFNREMQKSVDLLKKKLEVYEAEALSKIKELRASKEKEIETCLMLREKIESLQVQNMEHYSLTKDLESQKLRMEEKVSTLSLLHEEDIKKIEGLTKEIMTLKEEQRQSKLEHATLASLIKEKDAQITKAQSRNQELVDYIDNLKKVYIQKLELAHQTRLNNIKAVESDWNIYFKEISESQSVLEGKEATLSSTIKKLEIYVAELGAKLKESLRKYEEQGLELEKANSIIKEYELKLNDTNRELNQSKSLIDRFKTQIQTYSGFKKQYKNASMEVAEKLAKFERELENHNDLSLAQKETIHKLERQLKEVAKEKEFLHSEIDKWNQDKLDLKSEIESLKEQKSQGLDREKTLESFNSSLYDQIQNLKIELQSALQSDTQLMTENKLLTVTLETKLHTINAQNEQIGAFISFLSRMAHLLEKYYVVEDNKSPGELIEHIQNRVYDNVLILLNQNLKLEQKVVELENLCKDMKLVAGFDDVVPHNCSGIVSLTVTESGTPRPTNITPEKVVNVNRPRKLDFKKIVDHSKTLTNLTDESKVSLFKKDHLKLNSNSFLRKPSLAELARIVMKEKSTVSKPSASSAVLQSVYQLNNRLVQSNLMDAEILQLITEIKESLYQMVQSFAHEKSKQVITDILPNNQVDSDEIVFARYVKSLFGRSTLTNQEGFQKIHALFQTIDDLIQSNNRLSNEISARDSFVQKQIATCPVLI